MGTHVYGIMFSAGLAKFKDMVRLLFMYVCLFVLRSSFGGCFGLVTCINIQYIVLILDLKKEA